MSPRYEVLEHTADVGLRAFGETLEETFSVMAKGMVNLIVSSDSHVSCKEERLVEVEGYDLESLMVSWLSELLFQIYSEGFLPATVQSMRIQEHKNSITDSCEYSISATISGEIFRPKTHQLILEVKGVTYHLLKVERLHEPRKELDCEAKWWAQVILDI